MINWGNETKEELAAFNLARKLKIKSLTEFQVAEFIVMANDSLWYTQAKRWAEEDNPILQPGAKALIEFVDSGYHPKHGWWNMPTLWPDPEVLAQKMLDFARMIVGIEALRNESRMVISQGFTIMAEIILGKNWQELALIAVVKPEAIKEGFRQIMQPSNFIKKCICPECDRQVDRRVKKTGACCKAHINYVCTHPDCVALAQVRGWKHYTHNYETKIGQEHLPYRQNNSVQGD